MDDVICLETEAYHALIDEMYRYMEEKIGRKEPQWINKEEAMKLLKITSDSTLQDYRDNDEIRFTQPRRKKILYDRDSIYEFLDRTSNKPR